MDLLLDSEKFYLRNCEMRSDSIEEVLRLSPNLTTLELKWLDNHVCIGNKTWFENLGHVLRRLCSNLQKLTLDPSTTGTAFVSTSGVYLDSLKVLPHLKSLSIPFP